MTMPYTERLSKSRSCVTPPRLLWRDCATGDCDIILLLREVCALGHWTMNRKSGLVESFINANKESYE